MTLTLEELREALVSSETLEYHLMGVEQGASLLHAGPGWYPCIVTGIYKNGDVEISFTSLEEEDLGVTVLKKNIPIAFRRKGEQ